jgi:hypothetical protein
LNKAARLNHTDHRGRPEPPRERLRRKVRAVAAIATSQDEFFARLAQASIQIKLRHGSRNPSQITGYAVTLPGHTTPAGEPIWYGGGRLAPDLTLPRLRAGWSAQHDELTTRLGPARLAGLAFSNAGLYQRAARTVDDAATTMRQGGPDTADAIALGASDLLTALADSRERGRRGPLTDAAEQFDRAARGGMRHHRSTTKYRSSQAVHLRSMARLIALMGAISIDKETADALHLLYTLAALAESLAVLHDARNRYVEARAARAAAERLRASATASVGDQPRIAALYVPTPRTPSGPNLIADAVRPSRRKP